MKHQLKFILPIVIIFGLIGGVVAYLTGLSVTFTSLIVGLVCGALAVVASSKNMRKN